MSKKYIISCDPATSDNDLSYTFVYDWVEVKLDKTKERKEKIKRILKDYSSE